MTYYVNICLTFKLHDSSQRSENTSLLWLFKKKKKDLIIFLYWLCHSGFPVILFCSISASHRVWNTEGDYRWQITTQVSQTARVFCISSSFIHFAWSFSKNSNQFTIRRDKDFRSYFRDKTEHSCSCVYLFRGRDNPHLNPVLILRNHSNRPLFSGVCWHVHTSRGVYMTENLHK